MNQENIQNSPINYNPDKFKIFYDGITFKDIHEFVIDLKNIFTQMMTTYNEFKKNEKKLNTEDLQKLNNETHVKLIKLQKELETKLDYITDSNKVAESVVGKIRSKLIQLNGLCKSMDLSKDTDEKLNDLIDFYSKRVLEDKVVVIGKIISSKEDK